MRVLSLFLAFWMPATAQVAPMLNLVVIEGEGAVNNIRQRTAREPIVQVEDENHRPVAGAVVVFMLPSNGAGGSLRQRCQDLDHDHRQPRAGSRARAHAERGQRRLSDSRERLPQWSDGLDRHLADERHPDGRRRAASAERSPAN